MRYLKLPALSTLILLLAWFLQSSFDDGEKLGVPDLLVLDASAQQWIEHTTSPESALPLPAPDDLMTRAARRHRAPDAAKTRASNVGHTTGSDRSLSYRKPVLSSSQPIQTPSPQPVHSGGGGPTSAVAFAVKSYSPARNAMLDDLHRALVITLDDGPKPAEDLLQITPPVQGELSWRGERTLIFSPLPAWAPDTRYKVQLGEQWNTWFRTPGLVESHWPGRSDAANPATSIAVGFGVPVDRGSAEEAFTISPEVSGRFRWTDEQRLVFEPDQPLDYRTTYHVRFEGEIKDRVGVALPAVAGWEFTTRSPLVSAGPQGLVGVDSVVRLKFDAPVDRESVQAALVITPTLQGAVEWDGNALTFTPDDYLDPNTTYYVKLDSGAQDKAGRPLLDHDYRWSFTTDYVPRTVDFGYGPNIQLLDADGRRAVQLQTYGDGRVAFRLYAMDVGQFLDRYTSSFRGIGPSEQKSIKTADLSVVLAWEQDLERTGETTVPTSVGPGLYVLEAQKGPGRDHIILVLTRHVLIIKQAGGQLVTWASTFDRHDPVAGMHLRFYDRDGTQVAEGATEVRGLHRTTVSVDPKPLIVVGELNGDFTVGGLSPEWQVGWGWWGWWQESPSVPNATIYAYTDRPIYRPGQTVHTRAVIRRDDDAIYSLPAGEEVVLRLRDSRDNVIATRRLAPDEFGAVYADFGIADGGTVGTYNLEVNALGETTRQPFLVEAYRKPDFEVTLTPETVHVISGEPLSLTVEANYYFGQPVANATVELLPYVVDDYGWYGSEPALDYGYPYEKLRQVGRTDADGRLTVLLPADLTNGDDRQIWNIEATVTDASALNVSGHTRVIIHRARYGVSVHTEGYHYRPGAPIPVTAMVRDHDGSPEAGVELALGLYAWNPTTRDYDRAVVNVPVSTNAEGQAQSELITSQPGWYQLRVSGQDQVGRPVQAHSWVWVYDSDSVWDATSNGELRLSTDRVSYAPGETARMLIESPLSGPALLSFERGTTRRETVIQLNEGLNTLDFELMSDDAPNVHVAVAMWTPTRPEDEQWRWQSRPEAELLTARTEILVPADDRRLTVTITPDHSEYAPRGEAVFLVEIRDSAGRPVQAGFSMALVDEAIFALAADKTPDIFDAFYQPRPDLVRTYHSLRPIRWLDGGRGGGGGGGAMMGSPRSDFPDTAFWAPALATDADGRALVNVSLPDTLTSWRAVVRAVTPDTNVGQATADITVALPLSIQPVLPRFLVQGDRAILTAVVHNHMGVTQTAVVRLTASGLDLIGGALSATQQITLPANGTAAVGWPLLATELGHVNVRMDVAPKGDAEGGEPWHDAVELPLPVEPRAIPEVTTVSAEAGRAWVATIAMPDAAVPDLTRWELSLAPSIATGMLDGLEFLVDYPFG